MCESHIQHIEQSHNIPRHLLHSIALNESGRTLDSGKKVAWPWTINVDGKGYIYETKQKAINAVKQFQQQGKKSIDVGCMQINLRHHPHAFASLEHAFDPKHNVSYAATFLSSLKDQQGDWNKAIQHYHSATPKYHKLYHSRVSKTWKHLLKNDSQTLYHSTDLLMPTPPTDEIIQQAPSHFTKQFSPPTLWPKPQLKPAHSTKKHINKPTGRFIPLRQQHTQTNHKHIKSNGFRPATSSLKVRTQKFFPITVNKKA